MAMMPPGSMAPPGGPPGLGGPAPGGPPPFGGAPPPPPPQQMPGNVPGTPQSGGFPFLAAPYQDLSTQLPHHYQLLDVAASTLKQAINSGGFYKTPEVLAGVRHIESQLSQIIANYASGKGSRFLEAPTSSPSMSDSRKGDSSDEHETDEEEII